MILALIIGDMIPYNFSLFIFSCKMLNQVGYYILSVILMMFRLLITIILYYIMIALI
jgi:hypothetical protein